MNSTQSDITHPETPMSSACCLICRGHVFAYNLCVQHANRAERVGMADAFTNNEPGVIGEFKRRWAAHTGEPETPPKSDDGGGLLLVQAALRMSPSTTAGDVVHVIEELLKRERAQQCALSNLGTLADLADGAEPTAVWEAVIGRMDALRAEIDRLRRRVDELADRAQVAEIGLVLTPEEIRTRYADLIRSERYLAAAQYGRRVVEPEGEVARG